MRYWAVIVVFVLFGCEPTPYFSEHHEINAKAWSTEEVIAFSPTIEDRTATYNLHLIIDHLQSYRYENIYLKILTKFPDKEDKEEQLSINLADKKGIWVGNCSGDKCKCKVYLLENFKFPSTGTYTFELRQFTREEQLAGINSLELQLYKIEI